MHSPRGGKIRVLNSVKCMKAAPAAGIERRILVEDDKERRVPDTEEESDVEAHRRVPGAQDEPDDMRRETDDDPDVEGHRLVPGSERDRTVPRTEP